MILSIFNQAKAAWSRLNDWIKRGEKRAPIPRLASPAEVGAYLQAHGAYTGDPLGGAADFVLHPERLQAAMNDGPAALARISIDCDDWAAYACAALRLIPGCYPQLYTLWDDSGRFGHHVVCGYTWNGAAGVIDTNGHRRLKALNQEQLCVTLTEIYKRLGYIYTGAVPHDYPFD